MKKQIAIGVVGSLLASAAVAATQTVPSAALEAAQTEVRSMDMDRDGKLSATEHANGTKRMFGKMDVDGNGIVTVAEMDTAQRGMPGGAAPGAMSSQDKIKTIDTNKDGSLTAEEHATGSRTMFEKMDRDQDGFLTPEELQRGRDTLMKAKKS